VRSGQDGQRAAREAGGGKEWRRNDGRTVDGSDRGSA